VKSLLGEQLAAAEVTYDGLEGDRALAVVDAETGRALSAKANELLFSATARSSGGRVEVILGGEPFEALDPALAARLSSVLGRRVRIGAPQAGAPATIQSRTGTFESPAGTFFDSAPVHLVTTGCLEHFARLYPRGSFDVRRFRPNFLIGTSSEPVAGPEGIPEEAWIGSRLRIGGAELRVQKACVRCRMTAYAQADLPLDKGIFRTIGVHNERRLGVLARVTTPGRVLVGDAVAVL
jgi:uncharacterized protein YcbX